MSTELLRPRDVSELLDVAFALIRAHFPVFATLAGVTALPVLVASTATIAMLPELAPTMSGDDATVAAAAVASGGFSALQLLFIIPFSLAAWLWFFVAGSSLIFATSDAYRGQPVEAGSAFRRAMRATGDILGASIAKYLALFALFVLMMIAAGVLGMVSKLLAVAAMFGGFGFVVVLTLRWFVVTAVAALEDVTGSDALGRSHKLTRGASGRIFFLGLIMFVLAMCFSIASTFALSFAGSAIVAGLANSLWLLLYPFLNVIEAVTYFDQRIRTEGFDLEMMTQQLGPTAGGAGTGRPEGPFSRQPV